MSSKHTPQQALLSLKRKRFLLAILVLFGVCAFAWVFVSVFATQSKTTIPAQATAAAEPLSPNLDTTSLDALATKPYYSDADLSDFAIYVLVTDPFTRTQTVRPLERR